MVKVWAAHREAVSQSCSDTNTLEPPDDDSLQRDLEQLESDASAFQQATCQPLDVDIEDYSPLGMFNQSHSYAIQPTPNNNMIAGQEGFDIEISKISDPQNNGTIRNEFAPGGEGILSLQPQIIASTSGPTGGLQLSTNVRFAYSTQTPAGYYTTLFLYTVTGQF